MENNNTLKPDNRKSVYNKQTIKIMNIVLSGVLTALSFVFVFILPTIDIGITSVTPLSHLAIFIATFLNPFVAVFTCICAFLGFFLKGANPVILSRAASHIVFAVIGSLFFNKGKGFKGVSFYLICGLITLLHAFAEMCAAALTMWVTAPDKLSSYGIFVTIGLITGAHSIFDYAVAVTVYNGLSYAKLVPHRFDLRIMKKQTSPPVAETPAA